MEAATAIEYEFSHSIDTFQPYLPSGLVGEVAKYIYDAAPYPVQEIAMAGAIGFLAGIFGRAYNISEAGLNQYVLAIAPTGRGKEAMASGIATLVKAVAEIKDGKPSCPGILDFVGPAEFASEQALLKRLAKTPCIFSVVGEFGHKLRDMSGPKAPAHLRGIKRVMLDVYGKSGRNGFLGSMEYSDKDKNTVSVNSPSLTVIAEANSHSLSKSLNEDMVLDGFLPRFLTFNYEGDQGPLNEFRKGPPPELVARLVEIVAHILSLSTRDCCQDVVLTPEARGFIEGFRLYAQRHLNASKDIPSAELWSRAHLKALKTAALLAVGFQYINPVVTVDQAKWACDLIYYQTTTLIKKFDSGEVGSADGNEAKQQKAVERIVLSYLTTPFDKNKVYGGTEEMHANRIILASHIQRRLSDTAAFRVPGGAAKAIDAVLRRMCENDELRQIPQNQMAERYAMRARAFVPTPHAKFVTDYFSTR